MVFGEPPADELVRTAYAREAGDTAILYKGMSLADLAHVVGLIESEIIPRQAGGELLWALLEIHPSPPLDFAVDPGRGDSYSNRAAYLKMLTPSVGWLSAGRARREATTIGYRIAVRERLLVLAAALEEWATTGLELAEAHGATLFPDYTYLQPAQPSVFGHYLLTFVHPILRDLDRLRGALERTNVSPAGAGSVNGSRLPLDRGSLSEMLGFDEVITHTRDAMWQADGPIEIAAVIAAMLVNLDRLAEDLQIFSTAEFGLVELADRHARPSVIMPQKKNPYSLAYLRGLAGESIGTLAAMAAVGKTPSGQIDNRMFAYGDVPRALDRATDGVRLMADVLRGLTVNTEAATRRASQDFLGATDLAEVIMVDCGIDYKAAHGLVARAVRDAIGSGETTLSPDRLEAAAEATIGKKLGLSKERIAESLDPARIVRTRTGAGGAAEESVKRMIEDCRESVRQHRDWRLATGKRMVEAETRLLMRATALKIAPTSAGEGAPSGQGPTPDASVQAKSSKSASFEKLFEDLPKMPPRRRRFPTE
jgi:argininosuccinate lyase